MKTKSRNIKEAIYYLFILCLLLPIIQKQFQIFELSPLNGVHTRSIQPILSLKSWQKGSFQTEYDKYINDNIGFRESLIRLNNQLKFSFFNIINSDGVILGKDGMVFHENYISSYLGKDYIGKDSITAFVEKVKTVQDSLNNRGISFFIMIAPGKASIYPENIPEHYFDSDAKISNYEIFVDKLEKFNIQFLDLRAYILNNKEHFIHPIFPSHGVHWSGNTVAFVTDTMTKYIKARFNIPIAQIKLNPGETTVKNYRYTDYDIGEAMNLMCFLSEDSLHYPEVEFIVEKNTVKPDLLGVGDSFFQSFIGFYSILDSIFSKDSRLWYYNKIVEWPNKFFGKGVKIDQLDLQLEVLSKDLIILEMTEENIRLKGYGLIDDLLRLFKHDTHVPAYMEASYNKLMEDKYIIKKAEELYQLIGYSKEQMKHALVIDKLKQKQNGNKDFEQEVQQVIQAIHQDEEWLNNIRDQAKKNNISLKDNIRKNAEWVVNER